MFFTNLLVRYLGVYSNTDNFRDLSFKFKNYLNNYNKNYSINEYNNRLNIYSNNL